MARLRTTQDCSSVSVGGVEYAVGPDGIVEVPGEVAGLLCDGHGFVPVQDAPVAGAPAPVDAEPSAEDQPAEEQPEGDVATDDQPAADGKARRRR